jgi:orotidine-5'-phosphate decarboxylase
MAQLSARDRLIVALDYPTAAGPRQLLVRLRDSVQHYKVGNQLFTAEGPDIVRELVARGRRVFLDLKFHDIPNTVAEAVRSAAKLGVSIVNVHAAGGAAMLKAAIAAAHESERPPLLLAVTVLTSLDDAAIQETGTSGRVLDQVLRLAALAKNAGCDGVVASAREAAEIRRELGAGFVILTPGIRPAGSEAGDQARAVTPAEAITAGADYLVVGRPVTGAADPAEMARAVIAEIEKAAPPVETSRTK